MSGVSRNLRGRMDMGSPKVVVDVEKNRWRVQQCWEIHVESMGIDHHGGMDQ